MPNVSVIMPAYNVSRYPKGWVERACRSVLDQGAELCVGDDASTDNTIDLIYKIDPSIKIAHIDVNTGGDGAENAAAQMATGKYFCLLSCRSWYNEGALIEMSRFLDEHADIGFVYGCTHWHGDRKGIKQPPRQFLREHLRKSFMTSFGYLYRREAWDMGLRYDCSAYIPELGRSISISDRTFLMELVFCHGWNGFCLADLMVLHYIVGGIPQQSDLLIKYRKQVMNRFSQWQEMTLPKE